MRRREFIALIGSAAALPLFRVPVARAQEPGRIYRIGILTGAARQAPRMVAFFDELKVLSFVEGQNLKIVAGGFDLREDQFADVAATLAKAARTLSFASVMPRSALHSNRPTRVLSSPCRPIWSPRVLCARWPIPAAIPPASAFRERTRRQAAGNPDGGRA